jgi:hypothetical protein
MPYSALRKGVLNFRTLCATVVAVTALFITLTLPIPVYAIRPFVTDDARVVGEHMAQIETSVKYAEDGLVNLNLLAIGPTENSEFTIGFVDGFPLNRESNRSFSIVGPLLQFKYLFWEAKPNRYPGAAMAAGASPPWGKGEFRPSRWSEFVYLAMTESLFDEDRLLIHGNIGLSTTNPATVATWGIGTQIRIIGGLNGILEVFYNDPYAGAIGGAYQIGFRYVVSDKIQVDMTMGSGLFGSTQIPTFVGMGLRMLSNKLW